MILTIELNDGALVPVQEGGEHEGDAQYEGRQQNQGHQRLLQYVMYLCMYWAERPMSCTQEGDLCA